MTIQAAMPKTDAMHCQKRVEPHSISHVWYMAHTACSHTKSIYYRCFIGLNSPRPPNVLNGKIPHKCMHKPTLRNMFIVSEVMRARNAKILLLVLGQSDDKFGLHKA
jgi:hypothetical protein